MVFILQTLACFSGFFGLGGCFFIFMQHRTRILRIMLMFLLSLVFLSIGFWMATLSSLAPALNTRIMEGMIWVISVSGLLLNVAVLPVFVSAILSLPIRGIFQVLLRMWTALILVMGLLYPFVPDPTLVLLIMNIQLITTIAGSLIVMTIHRPSLPDTDFRKSITAFLVSSGIFLVLLIIDIFLKRLPFRFLDMFDNTSLPLYFIALNTGSLFFAGKFLNRGPLLVKGELTPECLTAFQITPREKEIIEQLLGGKTNQELADALFISVKTVENHLYNIYQKMKVKNRIQLVQTLQNWTQTTPE